MNRRTGSLADEIERFMARSVRSGECLMGPQAGYGWIKYDGGKQMKASRASYTVFNGSIPEGLVIRHTCDRPGCIEPTHLIVGTYADNSRDMRDRGRAASGTRNANATLSPEIVAAAVADYLRGGRSQAEVAGAHGISQTTFGRWVRADQRRDSGVDGFRQGKGRTALARGGLKPCGTRAAYARHRAEGTPVCDPCRESNREYMNAYKATQRRLRSAA